MKSIDTLTTDSLALSKTDLLSLKMPPEEEDSTNAWPSEPSPTSASMKPRVAVQVQHVRVETGNHDYHNVPVRIVVEGKKRRGSWQQWRTTYAP